ncbi:MAG: STAS domain-containing protein, partial [Muribaculaceae bacterium]|nr:STAS domain-containing protein [Muribaculaceae bacterium]
VFDLTIAIEIGLLLAVILFLRRVSENTTVKVYGEQLDAAEGTDLSNHEVLDLRPGVSVYEIDGPFFFGAATKFDETVRLSLQKRPKVRIIRMRKVPFIDSTGIHNLQLLIESSHREGIRIVLSGVKDSVRADLHKAGIDNMISEGCICDHISKAVVVANSIAEDNSETDISEALA